MPKINEKVLRDTILTKCFHRFSFNAETHHFEMDMHTTSAFIAEMKAEASAYDIPIERMLEFVQDVLQQAGTIDALSSYDSFPLSRLLAYDDVVLIHSGGQKLHLVWLQSNSFISGFIVVKDSMQIMPTGCFLRPLDFVLQTNHEALFQVYQNGEPYPEKGKLFRLPIVENIMIGHSKWISSVAKESNSYTGPETILSWGATRIRGKMFFLQDSLTEDNQAMFSINLTKGEFYLNPNFSKTLYTDEKQDWFDTMTTVCNCIKKKNKESTTLDNITRGRLSLFTISNKQYALKVTAKAVIEY